MEDFLGDFEATGGATPSSIKHINNDSSNENSRCLLDFPLFKLLLLLLILSVPSKSLFFIIIINIILNNKVKLRNKIKINLFDEVEGGVFLTLSRTLLSRAILLRAVPE